MLNAFGVWKETCFLADGSLFSDKSVWTSKHLDELDTYFIKKPDTSSRSFFDKLESQLSECQPGTHCLAAETLWLLYLCPGNIGQAKKRENISKVWQWSGESWNDDHPFLTDEVLHGVGSSGTSFNTNFWRELVFAIALARKFKSLPAAEQQSLTTECWQMSDWIEEIPESANRQFRHMFLYLWFPDQIERVFSIGNKQSIIKALSQAKATELSRTQVDQEIFDIRSRMEDEYQTDQLDFYESPLVNRWRKKESAAKPALEVNDRAIVVPAEGEPENIILYGPPGTGKTFALQNEYIPKYEGTTGSKTPEEQIRERIGELTWYETIAAALYDIGDQVQVPDLVEHPFITSKAAHQGRASKVNATIWHYLQAHSDPDAEHVNLDPSRYRTPVWFEKDANSIWSLLPNWLETGTYIVEWVESVHRAEAPEEKSQRYEFVTFHQSYSYEEFVEGIRPVLVDDVESNQGIAYELHRGVFRRICAEADRDPEHRYALFIDEINRGNISKIFGELITLIEPDKRAGKKSAIELRLPYSNELFSVPPNLDIIGTMNTADRSLAYIDTALRRRFVFKELLPRPDLLRDQKILNSDIDLTALLTTMNARIEALFDREHTIGHAYFTNLEPTASIDRLADVFEQKIIPLLTEYFFDDWSKVRAVLADDQIKDESLQFVTKNKAPANLAADYNQSGERFSINKAALTNPNAYTKIYSAKPTGDID